MNIPESHTPSPEEVDAARTAAGGWTRAQLAAWGVPWPPPAGWRYALAERWHTSQVEGDSRDAGAPTLA